MPTSSILKLVCQRSTIKTGGDDYPIFIGFVNSKELVNVANAPSFQPNTPNSEIAREVLEPPTKHWQRPLIEENVVAIRDRFDTDGEIMPNPILLAVNPELKQTVSMKEQQLASGASTGLWEISVDTNSNHDNKPLWIIDGQHRVKGLSETTRNNHPLPFVLLYSEVDDYKPATLAKIFAQVTTMAKALNPIHNAWMQYVFNLGNYAPDSFDWKAMTTVALLCSTQNFENKPNPFHSKIQFNPELELSTISPGGFDFDAKYLQELIRDKYFRDLGHSIQLSEKELAGQIALAIHSLRQIVKDPANSAFFGIGHHQQKYFRDGFISGVCSYLINNGKPRDWLEVLKELQFHNTDWDVSTWVNSTGGRAGTISKTIATECFEKIFKNASLPENVKNLCDYLRGTESYLQIEYKLIGADNELINRRNSDQIEKFLLAEGLDKKTINLPSETRWVKITSPCVNVGPTEISREGHKFNEEYQLPKFKRGKKFEDSELRSLRNSLTLEIKAEFYGNNSKTKTLTLKFDGTH